MSVKLPSSNALANKISQVRTEHQTFDRAAMDAGKSNVPEVNDLKTAIKNDSALELAERAAVNGGAALLPDATIYTVARTMEDGYSVGDTLTAAAIGLTIDAVELPIKGADAVASGVAAAMKGVRALLGQDE